MYGSNFYFRTRKKIKMRIWREKTHADVAILFQHPMNMGSGIDRQGNPYTSEYIETVEFYVANKLHGEFDFGMWVSRNPLLRFKADLIKQGTDCVLRWVDNRAVADSIRFTLRYDPPR